jgi:hypothetical protein
MVRREIQAYLSLRCRRKSSRIGTIPLLGSHDEDQHHPARHVSLKYTAHAALSAEESTPFIFPPTHVDLLLTLRWNIRAKTVYMYSQTKLPTDCKLPSVALDEDTGPLAKALVSAEPGKNLIAFGGWTSLGEFAEIWGRSLGVKSEYAHIGLNGQ